MTAAVLQIEKTQLNSYRKVAYREIRNKKSVAALEITIHENSVYF
jgi:hypothetical protein